MPACIRLTAGACMKTHTVRIPESTVVTSMPPSSKVTRRVTIYGSREYEGWLRGNASGVIAPLLTLPFRVLCTLDLPLWALLIVLWVYPCLKSLKGTHEYCLIPPRVKNLSTRWSGGQGTQGLDLFLMSHSISGLFFSPLKPTQSNYYQIVRQVLQ